MNLNNRFSNFTLSELKELLNIKEKEIAELKHIISIKENKNGEVREDLTNKTTAATKLTPSDIHRYSRQLILPEIGVKGQEKLKSASVLIVGAGGLGCPAGQYLAAAGIGVIGVVDHDSVESSNLHRQVLHSESTLGLPKTLSFAAALHNLNSSVTCVSHQLLLNSDNIGQILPRYDVVLDATDNPATRYLLNDACIKYGKPLVSGSALRWEGQLTVYNHQGGPCYRCIFPQPPLPGAAGNCSDSGVVGCIPGLIGCLQALEAIKIIIGLEASFSGHLLLVDGELGTLRKVHLRGEKPDCAVCSLPPKEIQLLDYVQFCHGAGPHDKVESLKLLDSSKRISCKEYQRLVAEGTDHVLLDVRPKQEVEICALPNAINIPLCQLEDRLPDLVELCKPNKSAVVVVVCRRGNDSQRAVARLEGKLPCSLVDLRGGLQAWSAEVDQGFPLY